MVNALQIARELGEAGDKVTVIFDGAGTQWIPHHALFERTKGNVAGACSYRPGAYGVKEEIEHTDVALLDEFDGYPSVGKLISNGYQILTF